MKRFLPPQIAKLVASSHDERMLESHRRAVTVLFCDLRGFTTFSEISEPEEVMLVLREYHTALGVLVDKFEGTVERFVGDGLLVIFNDPLPCPDPSLRAVRMAVEMRDAVAKLAVKWSRSGHEIGFGIGIAHGYATLGTVGYEGQFQYSVTGKVANLASRLCDHAKNGQILIDGNVFNAVETVADAEFTEEIEPQGLQPAREGIQRAQSEINSLDVAHSPASSAGIGSRDPAREIADAAAGVHRGSSRRGGVAARGPCAAAGDASDRVPQRPIR